MPSKPPKPAKAGTRKRTQPVFSAMKCVPCDGGTAPLSAKVIRQCLKQIPGWKFQHGAIRKTFHFKNYHKTMAFVNATAVISHREDHHPDLLVRYNQCEVSYFTHAINGISENDFICAAKVQKIAPA